MKKILLIEDDATLRENTREILELENYHVFTAGNGKEGLETARIRKPDLIISDILMPVMDGYKLYRCLSSDEETREIPFIFLSAKAEISDIREGMNLGADDYITKPFNERDLILAIESRLAKYEMIRKERKGPKAIPAVSNLHELRHFFETSGEGFKFEKNTEIYKEQKKATFVYMIKTGLIKTHRMDEFGKELITGLYKAPEFFGFYDFKGPSTYPETATALEDGFVYRLSSHKFQEILASSQQLTLELAQLLSDNLSVLKTHLLDTAYASVLKKTSKTILQFARLMPEHKQSGFRISRTDLASVAGISTESFIRSLSCLKKEGVIDIEGRNIKILNLQKLYNIK